jgi:hypothetical protein
MSPLCQPRARQSSPDVPADGGSVCDRAAALGDMIKETLYISLFTTPIFNPLTSVFRMYKVEQLVQQFKKFVISWCRGGVGGAFQYLFLGRGSLTSITSIPLAKHTYCTWRLNREPHAHTWYPATFRSSLKLSRYVVNCCFLATFHFQESKCKSLGGTGGTGGSTYSSTVFIAYTDVRSDVRNGKKLITVGTQSLSCPLIVTDRYTRWQW